MADVGDRERSDNVEWPPRADAVLDAAAGDERTLAAMLWQAFPRVVAFGRALGLGAADAEDLAGEVCERVVRGLAGLRDPAKFEAWFWSIARNRLRTTLRRRRRLRETFEVAGVADSTPEEQAVARDEGRIIGQAFAILKDRDRQILWLREVQRLDDAEVGRVMGMREGAVRVAAMRARRRLEEAYDGVARWQVGALVTASSLTGGLVSPRLGRWTDSLGARRAALATLGVSALALLLVAIAPIYLLLVGAALVTGIARRDRTPPPTN